MRATSSGRSDNLAVREAHDAEAGEQELGVAAAVALERPWGEVGGGAVGLGYEAVSGPEEVDLEALDAALTCGRGRPWVSIRARKLISSSSG